jgi:hypothetical protein
MMTNGPEAKAAEALAEMSDYDSKSIAKVIASCNSAHYLPLLRKVSAAIKVSSHGGDCMCFACGVNREIARLEAGAKGGE